jgi:ABC-type spermidine/putrescine transport system permease subunit I
MLGSLIFEQIIVVQNWPFGGAMSFVLLAIVLALLVLTNRSLGPRSSASRT